MFEFLRLTKSFSFERATVSGRLSTQPAMVFAAHLVAGAAGPATAALYDGHMEAGEPKVDLSAPTSGSDPRTFVPPIYFDRGVYLSVGSNVTSVIVMMRMTRDLKPAGSNVSLVSRLSSWILGSRPGE